MNSDAAARGVSDLSANAAAGKEEKAASRDTTLNDDDQAARPRQGQATLEEQ